MRGKFELVFFGGATAPYMPRYRRYHRTLDSAKQTAREVLKKLDDKQKPCACHMPLVYGPGCGKDGMAVAAR